VERQTVPRASNYSELMTLACKNALLAPGDEVQTLAAREGRPGGPEGRIGPSATAPPAGDGSRC
jgi:hypothetical protein